MGTNRLGTKLLHTKTLLEIRKKNGFSRYDLADYPWVSRSLIELAERGLRKLPMTTHLKATEMLMVWLIVNAPGMTLEIIIKHEKISKVWQKYHEQKLAAHQYQLKILM